MRVGLIARSESRGLGNQTFEFYRHVKPAKVLLIEMARDAGYPTHPEWYPGATVLPFHSELDLVRVRDWLADLDVVYSAETFYDWRIVGIAHELGVGTVCHVNPEFYKHHSNDDPHPSAWWSATPWRLEHLPAGTRVVPMPIPLDRFVPAPECEGPVRWVHVIGKRAVHDRNGTEFLWNALRRTRFPHDVVVYAQHPRKVTPPRLQPNVALTVSEGPEDYWELYDGRDALVMPRRYGGLCLPVLEAMGAGLGVLMSDMEPQRSCWPVETVPVLPGRVFDMPGGQVEVGSMSPHRLAEAMDRWSADPGLVRKAQAESRVFASANSWEAKLPELIAELVLASHA